VRDQLLRIVNRPHEHPAPQPVLPKQFADPVSVSNQLPKVSRHLVPLSLVSGAYLRFLDCIALIPAPRAIHAEALKTKISSVGIGNPLIPTWTMALAKEQIAMRLPGLP
jgi:hypothetical protein